jgi:hypothetical protein
MGSHWLFVGRKGLDIFVSALGGENAVPKRQEKQAGYRSRFMELTDEVIADMGVTDENQPLHKEIVARAKEIWNKNGYGDGMSEHTARQIATLVRQPEGKKGKGKKR